MFKSCLGPKRGFYGFFGDFGLQHESIQCIIYKVAPCYCRYAIQIENLVFVY